MTTNDRTDVTPQPTLRELNKAVLIALGAAATIVTVVVLPAERGIDVTGLGHVLGLTQMGQMKSAQGQGFAAGPVAGDSVTTTPDGGRRVQIVLGPYGGREAKAVMKVGAEMTYEWSTDGPPVEFEFHGDPADPKSPGAYASYEKGNKPSAEGSFKAAFSGRHGWFWKNASPRPVIVTATVKGAVESFAPLDSGGQAVAGAGSAPAAAQPEPDAAAYHVEMPLKQLMSGVLAPSAKEIWDRQGYVSDEKGTRSLFPKDSREWKMMETAALRLAELSNVLLLPGRRVDDRTWTDSAAALHKAALRLAESSRRKDEAAFLETGMELSEACNSCHGKFAPGVE